MTKSSGLGGFLTPPEFEVNRMNAETAARWAELSRGQSVYSGLVCYWMQENPEQGDAFTGQHCSYCRTRLTDKMTTCNYCGAPRDR